MDLAVGVALDVVGASALASLGWAPALTHCEATRTQHANLSIVFAFNLILLFKTLKSSTETL